MHVCNVSNYTKVQYLKASLDFFIISSVFDMFTFSGYRLPKRIVVNLLKTGFSQQRYRTEHPFNSNPNNIPNNFHYRNLCVKYLSNIFAFECFSYVWVELNSGTVNEHQQYESFTKTVTP